MAGKKRDYYEILGVPPNATDDEVKTAFRKLAKKLHPDVNEGKDRGKFQELSEAYGILKDPEKRSLYNRFGFGLGKTGVEGSGPASPFGFDIKDPFFDSLFGGGLTDFETFFGFKPVGNQRKSTHTQEQSIPWREENFSLPVNDFGLIEGLILANQFKGDGVWRVLRSPEDKRPRLSSPGDMVGVSPFVYKIEKSEGRIKIYRNLDDVVARKEDRPKVRSWRLTIDIDAESLRHLGVELPRGFLSDGYFTALITTAEGLVRSADTNDFSLKVALRSTQLAVQAIRKWEETHKDLIEPVSDFRLVELPSRLGRAKALVEFQRTSAHPETGTASINKG